MVAPRCSNSPVAYTSATERKQKRTISSNFGTHSAKRERYGTIGTIAKTGGQCRVFENVCHPATVPAVLEIRTRLYPLFEVDCSITYATVHSVLISGTVLTLPLSDSSKTFQPVCVE